MANNRIKVNYKIGNNTLVLILLTLYLVIYYAYYERSFNLASSDTETLKLYNMQESTFEKHREKVKWLLILFSIIIIAVRISFASVFLLAGTYLNNKVKIGYKKIANTVLLAEFIFIVRDILILLERMIRSHPEKAVFDPSLSLNSFFTDFLTDYPILALPSRSLSLYLLLYIFIIALIIGRQNLSFRSSLSFTFKYFGLSYFIWITLAVTFSLYASNLT